MDSGFETDIFEAPYAPSIVSRISQPDEIEYSLENPIALRQKKSTIKLIPITTKYKSLSLMVGSHILLLNPLPTYICTSTSFSIICLDTVPNFGEKTETIERREIYLHGTRLTCWEFWTPPHHRLSVFVRHFGGLYYYSVEQPRGGAFAQVRLESQQRCSRQVPELIGSGASNGTSCEV